METITVDSNMVDWYEVFADNIIANQFEDGHFEHLADTWMPELDTVFALLTLEKAAPPPLHQLNHFTCYSVEPTEPIGEKVNLEDQFVAIYNVTVMDAAFFCNPATKFHCNATTPISNFDHHLTVYNIVYYVEPQTFSVKVDNQFGTQDLTIFGPFGLVVPTQKLMPGDHEPPVGLDHFLYYDVIEGPDVNVEVSLSDQFLAEQAGLVTSPVGFATPVQKTHGGDVTEIGNPEAHLVFYEREGGIFEMEVQVVNQFGSNQTLDVSGPVRLAVPSETECYYNLTVSSIGGGSVLIPGEGTFTYDCGTEVDLYAFASDNCWFDKWTGDVGTIANINDPATTIIMNGHYSITANFDCYGSCGGFISISVRDTPIAKEVQTLLGLLVLVSVPSALWVRKRRGSRNGCRST